jgi:hypothetical protein
MRTPTHRLSYKILASRLELFLDRRAITLLLLTLLIFAPSSLFFTQSSTNDSPNSNEPTNALSINPEVPVSFATVQNSTSLLPNPYEIYQKEPAPMGIADYGIGPKGIPYAYNSRSFLGSASIQGFLISATSGKSGSGPITLQMNLNLKFDNNGSTYVYWVQNVMSVSNASNYVSFVDNVWNFSSPKADVYASALTGSGSIGSYGTTYFYYDQAASNLPGNDISMPANFDVRLMMNSSTNQYGHPVVHFLYNDGYGWVTYDTVTFIFAGKVISSPSFLVSGRSYEPTGYTFYDAELVMGGSDGGQAYGIQSNVRLELEYFNGDNFQMITNAYNFGSDTAETIGNVSGIYEFYPQNGTLFSNVTSGNCSLGPLYLSTQICILNITSPMSNGVLVDNSTPYSFENRDINVTIGPSVYSNVDGYYPFKIYTDSGSLVWSKDLKLYAGEYLPVDVHSYDITFTETSLPAGMTWYLNLSNGQSFESTTSSITIYLCNGTYSFTAAPSSINYLSSTGSFTVAGTTIAVDVQFSAVQLRTYSVNFIESGLSPEVNWSVTLSGTTLSSSSRNITFIVLNGTYSYSIASSDKEYVPSPSSGSLTINGVNVTINVSFTLVTYDVTFSENGLPSGTSWFLNFTGGQSLSSEGTEIIVLEPNGTYYFTVETSNKQYSASSGFIVVKGKSLQEMISFALVKYPVVFVQSGLPGGLLWTVLFDNVTRVSTNELVFEVPNGTYHFTVFNISGFNANTYADSITVNGNSVSYHISWTLVSYSVTLYGNGIPSGVQWSATINGTTFYGVHINATLNSTTPQMIFELPNGTYSYSVQMPRGYRITNGNGNIAINGTTIEEHVTVVGPVNYSLIAIFAMILVFIAAIGTTLVIKYRGKSTLAREDRFIKKRK